MTRRRETARAVAAAAFAVWMAGGAAPRPLAQGRDSPPPGVNVRCSEPFGGLRIPEISFVVATARVDTVMDAAELDGRSGPVYGQLAEIHRSGGAGRGDVPTDTNSEAVFVPWGFDEACRPIPWTGSWRWADVGTEGFYRGLLRPSDRWIDGLPTFDVHAAVWEGFPVSPWSHPMSAGRPRLDAVQLFDLYDHLPTADGVASRPYGAVSGLVEWRRDAGDLAERYPARTLLMSAFRVAELARLRSSPLSFGGTYRIRIEAGADTLATFALRTGGAGSEPLDFTTEAGTVPAAPAPTTAFAVPSALAATESRLPAEATPGRTECRREHGLRVEAREAADSDDGHAWSAELPLRFIAACFRGAAILDALRASPGDGGGETPGLADYPGEFRQEADGRFTFRQAALLPDGTPVTLTGERIGTEILPTPEGLPLS